MAQGSRQVALKRNCVGRQDKCGQLAAALTQHCVVRFLVAQSSLSSGKGLREWLTDIGRRVSKLFFQLLSSSPIGTA